jgi:hypothetical protein
MLLKRICCSRREDGDTDYSSRVQEYASKPIPAQFIIAIIRDSRTSYKTQLVRFTDCIPAACNV